jgi:hypothetical protein
MPDLRVAFWNVQNLFEPGPDPRRPRDEDELNAKLDVLATALRGLFDGEGRICSGWPRSGPT